MPPSSAPGRLPIAIAMIAALAFAIWYDNTDRSAQPPASLPGAATPAAAPVAAPEAATPTASAASAQTAPPPASSATSPPIPAEARTPEANSSAPRDTLRDLISKLAGLVTCFNRADRTARSSIDRYQSWLDDKKAGPSGREDIVYGLYQISASAVEECRKGAANAVRTSPSLPALEQAAQAYLEALTRLTVSTDEAYAYYNRKDYEDDGFRKGKAMHPGLIEDMDAFERSSDAFLELLQPESDKALAAQLQSVEATQGRKLTYWRLATMASARRLASSIRKPSFDVGVATAALAEFERLSDETTAYAKAHKDETQLGWVTMETSLDAFRVAAKERVRRVRDKKPYNEGEKMMVGGFGGWMVAGSPQNLVSAYNRLVASGSGIQVRGLQGPQELQDLQL